MNVDQNQAIQIGRLLRSGINGCVIGCQVAQINTPVFAGLARIPLDESGAYQVYGLIFDIHVDDDGLVRQLITSPQIESNIISDNRLNRNIPLEISVLFLGYEQEKRIFHLIPPRPPLTLDEIFLCTPDETCRFTNAGHFGYFRHILRQPDLPVGELLASFVRLTTSAQTAAGNLDWTTRAVQELITLLRDDYPTLMAVLGALSDAQIFQEA